MYASHEDSLLYSFYSFCLSKEYESAIEWHGLSDNVIWYRSLKKSNINFAKEVFDFIIQQKDCYVLTFDVKSFFDTLEHERIKKSICNILWEAKLTEDVYNIFKSITKYHYVDLYTALNKLKIKHPSKLNRLCTREIFKKDIKEHVKVNEDSIGIPQWTPISALISNIYMLDFDCKISKFALEVWALYRRYADDIIVILPDLNDTCFQQFQDLIQTEIEKIGLKISVNKTDFFKVMTSWDKKIIENIWWKRQTIDYLGFSYNGKRIHIRPSSMYRYNRKAFLGAKHEILKNLKLAKKLFYSRFSKYTYFDNKNHKKNFPSYLRNAIKIMWEEDESNSLLKRQLRRTNKTLGKLYTRALKDLEKK